MAQQRSYRAVQELAARQTIGDRLSSNSDAQLIGRDQELDVLRRALTSNTPIVIHLYGLPGIGKSALVAIFAEEVRNSEGGVLEIECGAVEPTKISLLNELGRILDCKTELGAIAAAITGLPPPVLLLFDGYEAFRLLDTWVRQVLLPAMPDNVLVLFVSKLPPSEAWTDAPAWQNLFQAMQLGPLSESAATTLLVDLKVPVEAIGPLVRFAAGHPLALTQAAQAARRRPSERGYAEAADS